MVPTYKTTKIQTKQRNCELREDDYPILITASSGAHLEIAFTLLPSLLLSFIHRVTQLCDLGNDEGLLSRR